MKIGTTTCAFRQRRNGGEDITYPESIARCKAAGFEALDLYLCSMRYEGKSVFGRDDWKEYVEEMREAAEKNRITFCQSHPPYYKLYETVDSMDPLEYDYFQRMQERSLEITAAVGAPWAVIHPVWDTATEDVKAQLELNHRMFDKAVDTAVRLGIGVAFENMGRPAAGWGKRFGAQPEELAMLADSFHTEHVGVCWDFGHANLGCPDRQPEALRLLGSRLRVVHVDDNKGVNDDHLIPFQGNIEWERIMPVLREIGYRGELNLELSLTANMPEQIKDEAMVFAAHAARLLMNMM